MTSITFNLKECLCELFVTNIILIAQRLLLLTGQPSLRLVKKAVITMPSAAMTVERRSHYEKIDFRLTASSASTALLTVRPSNSNRLPTIKAIGMFTASTASSAS
jgi:hypothetical protein